MRNVMPEEQQGMLVPRRFQEYANSCESKRFNSMPETYVGNNFKDFYTAKLEVAGKVKRRRLHPHQGLRKKFLKLKGEVEKAKKDVKKFKGSFDFVLKTANDCYDRLFVASRINKWLKIELVAAKFKKN